jgi:hypothetical protein
MRIFVVLICSLTLALVNASAQEPQATKEKKKAAPTRQAQHGKPAGRPAQAKPAEVGNAKRTGQPTHVAKPAEVGKTKGARAATTYGKPAEVGKTKAAAKTTPTGKAGARAARPTPTGKAAAAAGKPTPTGKAAQAGKRGATPVPASGRKPGKPGAAGVAAGKPFKPQHFNVASKNKPNPANAPPVKFEQNKRIQGSQNWQGSSYQVFRNYRSEWHDRGWWRSHYPRVVFVFGGWYYWNAGYWFPAWGYDPNAYYFYNGPIYGYHGLPPDQVIANVQASLQQQGYYHGEVDGLLGPLTRDAIANYQRDHGLYVTSAIDQPTLQSLGMA